MNLFRIDSPLMKWLTKLANMIFVSCLWLLFSLPLITLIPAGAALHRTTNEIIHGTGNGVVRVFWDTFKENWKGGIPLSILCILSFVILFSCVFFGWNNLQTVLGCFYFALGVVLLLIWAVFVQQLPAVLVAFEGKTTMLLRLGGFLSAVRFGQSVLCFLLMLILLFLCWFVPILIFIAPGLFSDLTCSSVENGLKKTYQRLGIPDEAQDKNSSIPAEPSENRQDSSALELEKRMG